MESRYTESRPILPKQLQYVVLLCAVCTVVFVAVTRYCIDTSMSDLLLPIITLLAAVTVILCFILRYDIEVYDDSIAITYMFKRIEIRFENILDSTVGEANQIRSYTGFNYKGVKNRYYSAIGEDMAVGVKLKGKIVIVFTSSDPEKIKSLIPVECKE